MTDSVPKVRRRAAALFVAALLATGMTVAFLPASASAEGPEPSLQSSPSPSEVASPSPTDEPTPSPTDPPTVSPSEEPTPSPTDEPTPTTTETPSPSPTDPPTSIPTGSPWPAPSSGVFPPWIRSGVGVAMVRVLRNERDHPSPRLAGDDRDWRGWTPSTDWGTYSTELLDRRATRLRRAGAAEATILRRVYRPFIVEGPATWSDSWHAPRFAGGFHLHEGQDVLCSYGAPVLAAVDGRLAFGENSLGGLAAYVVSPDGGFLYYAHLSEQRTELTGTEVHPGDVIGRCGATGDATVPHVHFSLYGADGVAQNPMKLLVGLLHEAEDRSVGERSEPNPAAQLPRGLVLEGPQPVTSASSDPAPVVVYRSGVAVGDHAGLWDMLALVGAFGVILVPAGLMRLPRFRAFARLSDAP